jgi:hypothetical protein
MYIHTHTCVNTHELTHHGCAAVLLLQYEGLLCVALGIPPISLLLLLLLLLAGKWLLRLML